MIELLAHTAVLNHISNDILKETQKRLVGSNVDIMFEYGPELPLMFNRSNMCEHTRRFVQFSQFHALYEEAY